MQFFFSNSQLIKIVAMVYATKLQVANHQKIDNDKLILATNSDCSVTKNLLV